MATHSGGGTPRRTAVAIPIPGTDSARLIIIPQLASDKALTGDEELLLKLHNELSAAQSALAEKEREGPSKEALRLAKEFVKDPDTRAQVKVELTANGWGKLADMIDEAGVLAREILRLAAPPAGEGKEKG
jgi:hypothetical protein